MGAVTYQSTEVQEFLNANFVCYKLNVHDSDHPDRTLLRDFRLLWEPGFVFLDHRGVELRRQVGFLPPNEFIAEASMALGKNDLLHGRYQRSLSHFQEARSISNSSAPEAIYWAGIATLRLAGGDKEQLRVAWEPLRERFPTSAWWAKADVFGSA